MIVNTHPASKSGEHWTAIILQVANKAEYFDSFGMPPLQPEVLHHLRKTCSSWVYSSKTLQHPLAVTCGPFCCAYLISRASGCSYQAFIDSFSNDLAANEEAVWARLKLGTQRPISQLTQSRQ